MAYDYKQIGVTAAKVVSIFAVAGGLLWWARTPSRVPQPQDEAEIMTAVLERHYAMGRTNTQYVLHYPTNLSTWISGSITNWETNSVLAFFTVSVNTAPSGLPQIFSTLPTNLPVVDAGGYYTADNGNLVAIPAVVVLYDVIFNNGNASNVYWVTYDPYYYTGFWPTLTPEYDYGVLADASVMGSYDLSPGYTDVISIVSIVPQYTVLTNSPGGVHTNLVDKYPNATAQYPAGIRTAIEPATVNMFTHPLHWLLPSNSYMQTGVWDGSFAGHSNTVLRWLDTDTAWWTNLVTWGTATWVTASNYWTTNLAVYTNIVWTNTPPGTNYTWHTNTWIKTNVLLSVSNVVHTTNVNAWVGSGVAPYTIPAKAFSFERDAKGWYWSTNAYNDMARALSLMQWQGTEVLVWESWPTNYTLTLSTNVVTVSNVNWSSVAWQTNVADSTDIGAELEFSLTGYGHQEVFSELNSLVLHWFEYPDPPGVGANDWSSFDVSVSGHLRGMRPVLHIVTNAISATNVMVYMDQIQGPAGWSTYPTYWGDVTNHPAPGITNSILFAVTNGATWSGDSTQALYHAGYPYLPTGAVPSIVWVSGVVSTLHYEITNTIWVNPYLATGYTWGPGVPAPGYTNGYYTRWVEDIVAGAGQDQGFRLPKHGYGTYRRQFSALTNYTQHAPPR